MPSIVRLDKVRSIYDGHIYSIVNNTSDMENGMVCKVGGISTGNRDLRDIETPSYDGDGALALVSHSEINYQESSATDQALGNFLIEAGKSFRAYNLEDNDIFSVSHDGLTLIDSSVGPVKGNYVISQNGFNLKEVSSIKTAKPIKNPTTAPTLVETANTASTLPAGTYYVTYTWVNANGETETSPESSITTAGGSQVDVTMPTLPADATSVNVYMSTSSGTETLQGNTTTTTYVQDTDLVAGSSMPTRNETILEKFVGKIIALDTIGTNTVVGSNGTVGRLVNLAVIEVIRNRNF